MHWLMWDSLIIATATGIGSCFGAFCTRLGNIAARVSAVSRTKLTQPVDGRGDSEIVISVTPLTQKSSLRAGIGIWAVASGTYAAYLVWRVHWWAAQPIITHEAYPYFFPVVGLVWPFCSVLLVRSIFRVVRTRYSVLTSTFIVPLVFSIHLILFAALLLFLTIFGHYASGGLE